MKSIYLPKRRVKHESLTNSLPKYLFLAFALTGSVFIWGIKSYFSESGGVTAAIVAVLFIVTYCVLSYFTRLFSIREDIIGDNAYYMGFLFTLTSLSYALANFINENSADSIIASFGIALWSTIAGIAARVFFSQLRQDPDDIEKDARAKIAETARALSIELGSATVSFNEYRRGLEQSLSEAFTDNKTKIADTLVETLNRFTNTTEEMGKHIDSAFSEFSSHTQKLNETSEKTVVALENLNSRISSIDSPDKLLNQKFDSLFSDLDTLNGKMRNLVESQVFSNNELVKGADGIKDRVSMLSSQLEEMRKQSEIVGISNSALNKFSDQISSLPQSLEQLSSSISKFIDKNQSDVQRATAYADALEAQLERSRSYTEETHSALSSMTRTLAEKLS